MTSAASLPVTVSVEEVPARAVAGRPPSVRRVVVPGETVTAADRPLTVATAVSNAATVLLPAVKSLTPAKVCRPLSAAVNV